MTRANVPHVISDDSALGGQLVSGSLKFDGTKSQYLTRTPSSASNRRTFTWSGWVKRNQPIRESYFSAGNTTNSSFGLDFDSSNLSSPWIYDYTSGFDWQIKANQQLRDSGNFFHYLVAYNTTSSTAAERFQFNRGNACRRGLIEDRISGS